MDQATLSRMSHISDSDVEADIEFMRWSMRLYGVRRYYRQRNWEQEARDADYAALIEPFPKLENVAEHSWHVADIVSVLAGHFPKLDRGICLEIAILHDKLEILTGDFNPSGRDGTGGKTYAFNPDIGHKKESSEATALPKLLARTRPSLRLHYQQLFREILTPSTDEARFVKAIDKLQTLIYILAKKRGDLNEKELLFTLQYSRKSVQYFPPLARHYAYARELIMASVAEHRKCSVNALEQSLPPEQMRLL